MTELRVCYEDTDAWGVVYYGKYLRFLEQGRTEFFRARGLSVRELHEKGYILPVVRLEIDYLTPAVLDDLLRVETLVRGVTRATITFGQQVLRVGEGKMLVDAQVTLVFIGEGKKARRLPPELLAALGTASGE